MCMHVVVSFVLDMMMYRLAQKAFAETLQCNQSEIQRGF